MYRPLINREGKSLSDPAFFISDTPSDSCNACGASSISNCLGNSRADTFIKSGGNEVVLFKACAQKQLDDGAGSGTCAGGDDLDLFLLFAHELQRIEQSYQGNDGSAVLVIVEEGISHFSFNFRPISKQRVRRYPPD